MYDSLGSSIPRYFDAFASDETAMHVDASPGAGVLMRMLDVVDYGVMLVLDDGHVVFANHVARRELDTCHPLQLLGDKLLARYPRDVGALRSAVDSAAHKGLQRLITLGSGSGEAVPVSVIPMTDGTTETLHSAMLVFGKCKVCDELGADAFARQYELTTAEARVLKLLCSGRKPTEIAHAQGVALSTVRTHIGSVRGKTGARSIGALIREVAKLPPLVNCSPWRVATPWRPA